VTVWGLIPIAVISYVCLLKHGGSYLRRVELPPVLSITST